MFYSKAIILCCLLIGLSDAYFRNFGFKKIKRAHPQRPNRPTYIEYADKYETRKFPKNFQFGAATASYQIEGGWNADGKIPSVWDEFVHSHPEKIQNNATGDIACDSYHLWERDIEMCVELGIQVYRFSISWTRLYPNGKINPAGLRYYNNLINGLWLKGIEPLVTMFHWDLPHHLQQMGGFSNPMIVPLFESYARILYQHFGDRVKQWITFNEAAVFCGYGYGRATMAPGLNNTIAQFACSKYLLLSHAAMYHTYDKEFRYTQKGKVAMTFAVMWFEPASKSKGDAIAAERAFTMAFLQYAVPIYKGDWPQVMKDAVEKLSAKRGYPRSILQKFTKSEISYIKGTSDFLGVNLYTAMLASEPSAKGTTQQLGYDEISDVVYSVDPTWYQAESDWLHDVPYAIYAALKYIKHHYNNTPVFITENGWSTNGTIYDYSRVDYMRGYLNKMLNAISEGCNVIGYCAWSLMDNFEWARGYTEKFGLYSVDFNDRKRTPNFSAFVYKHIIRTSNVLDIADSRTGASETYSLSSVPDGRDVLMYVSNAHTK